MSRGKHPLFAYTPLRPALLAELPALHPVFILFAGPPPCNPAPPFEKGVDPKTFSVDGQHPFLEKGKNLECRNNGFPGTDLWIPCAVPSVGVLCSRAWWEASSESLWVFDDASQLHDLKRPSLFRRDKVPARNTHKIVRLGLHTPRKVFEGSKGRFFKNAPWQGVGQGSTKREQTYMAGHAFSGGAKSFHETPQIVQLGIYAPKKVFEGSKGRFFENAPLQGVGQGPTVERPAFLLLFRLHRFFRIQFGTIHA